VCVCVCVLYIRTDQLSEIRKTTFAAIICDNSDEIESVQLHVMQSSRKVGNGRVGCDSLIKTSLDPWKEELDAATPAAVPQDPTTIPQDSTTIPQSPTTTLPDPNAAAAAAEVTTSSSNNNNSDGSQSTDVLHPEKIGSTTAKT